MENRAIRLSMLAAAVVLLSGGAQAQDSNAKVAQTAVEEWLSLVDQAKYAASWDAAASLFKKAVTQDKWTSAVQHAREPFGQLKSRVLKSATAATTLPGAPDGDYVVLQFNTAFEQKAAAVETVTATHETDGSWRVGGYFVR